MSVVWILQKNLQSEQAYDVLKQQLERQNNQYIEVSVVPFTDITIPEVHVEIGTSVFVCGSTSLSRVAKRQGWSPGYLDDNLDYNLLLKHYGSHMLNSDSVISKIIDVEKTWDTFFIRPVDDSKCFSGHVMKWEEFVDWRHNLIKLNYNGVNFGLNDFVVVSSLKQIFTEYRFYVIDKKVVTGSMYKRGNQVHYSDYIPEYVAEFAQQMADMWQPNRAFALDICETAEGMKVMEINSINSAGFYSCDMGKFVNAINLMCSSET